MFGWKKVVLRLTLGWILALPALVQAQVGKVSGYMFGDFYWMASHHDSTVENSQGFWFRRIYFTYDKTLTKTLAIRVRLEMASAGNFSTTSKALVPFVKDAYLRWKTGQAQIYLGISEPPTFRVVEKHWGYRAVEKTPQDLHRIGSSHDFGVSVRGAFTRDGKFRYHVMLANGSGNKTEVDRGKKFMLSLAYQPSERLFFEAYADRNDKDGPADWYTYQGFASYHHPFFRTGVTYVHQVRQQPGEEDLELDIFSVYAVADISQKVDVLARVDRMFDPDPRGDSIAYLPFSTARIA